MNFSKTLQFGAVDLAYQALNSTRNPIHWICFSTLLLVGIILRIWAFQGYADSDPRAYSELADSLSRGILEIPGYAGPPVFPLRLGIYIPTAGLIRLFGLSEVTLVAYPFVASIFGVLLAYAAARIFFTPIAGLIALGLFATFPADIAMASRLLPDAIASLYANLGVVLVYIAMTKPRMDQTASIGFLAGFCFGLSWLCKESVAFLAPLVLAISIFPSQSRPMPSMLIGIAAIAAGSVLVLIGELSFYKELTGDFLFRMHETERNYEYAAVWFFSETSHVSGWAERSYAAALVARLFLEGPSAIFLQANFNYLPLIGIFSLLWAAISRQKRFIVPAFWFLSLVLMFNFMTSSFRTYMPLPLFERYLSSLFLPTVMLVSGLLANLLEPNSATRDWQSRRSLGMIMVVAIVLVSSTQFRSLTWGRTETVEREVAKILRPSDIVYTDYRTAGNLIFFRDGRLASASETTIPWETAKLEEAKSGTYILVNVNKINFLSKNYKYKAPAFVNYAQHSWKKVGGFGRATLYAKDID